MYEIVTLNGKANASNLEGYQVQTRAEVAQLPTTCAIGSLALVEEDFSIWILTNGREWEEFEV